MEKSLVLLFIVGAILFVDGSYNASKEKIPTKEENVDVKEKCYLDGFETQHISCDVVNDDQQLVPHGKRCTIENVNEDPPRVEELICNNGHWSRTDFTIDACKAGYYSQTGVQPCTACDHGTYSTTYGSMSCTKCPGSKITLKSASTNITECKDFDITYMPLNTTYTIIPAVLTQQNITSLDDMTVELWVKCTSCDNILNITGEDDAPILSIEGIDQLEITWLGTIYKTGECINGVDTWKKITLNATDGFISVYIDDMKLITAANTSLSMSTTVNITVGGDGFIGSISQVNMWSADYIRSFTPTNTCFIESPGNLIAWQQFSETDGTFVLTQSQCDGFDNCQSMPCQNNGVCSDKLDGFTCNCTEGFDGTTCEINIDDCIDKMCDNGGTCLDDINRSTCLCPQGYTGELCEYQYVDGGWTDWVESGGCSVTCGNGTKLMSRACENPEPLYTGKECVGDHFQIVECATNIQCIEETKTTSPSPDKPGKPISNTVIIAVVTSVVALIIVCTSIVLLLFKKWRNQARVNNSSVDLIKIQQPSIQCSDIQQSKKMLRRVPPTSCQNPLITVDTSEPTNLHGDCIPSSPPPHEAKV